MAGARRHVPVTTRCSLQRPSALLAPPHLLQARGPPSTPQSHFRAGLARTCSARSSRKAPWRLPGSADGAVATKSRGCGQSERGPRLTPPVPGVRPVQGAPRSSGVRRRHLAWLCKPSAPGRSRRVLRLQRRRGRHHPHSPEAGSGGSGDPWVTPGHQPRWTKEPSPVGIVSWPRGTTVLFKPRTQGHRAGAETPS